MKLGFTGTQDGMTEEQDAALGDFLVKLRKINLYRSGEAIEFHHGDCIGADEQAHQIAYTLGFEIFIHPPANNSKRAFCESPGITVLLPKPYLARNRDIVDSTNILIAAPKEPEVLRSGTWATVRYVRREGKRIVLIDPDGVLNYEDRKEVK